MVSKKVRLVLFLFVLLLIPTLGHAVEVEEVIGGNILSLNTGEKVRLAGIDTQEILSPGKRGNTFSEEAIRYIANLFSEGEIEIIDSGLPADALGRRQVYVFLIETKKKTDIETKTAVSENVKTLVNLELIRRGYAKMTRGYSRKYHRSFKIAEAEAKKAKVGLWRG